LYIGWPSEVLALSGVRGHGKVTSLIFGNNQ